jgi:hypothetical protein
MELINNVFLGGMWIASYRCLTLERERELRRKPTTTINEPL